MRPLPDHGEESHEHEGWWNGLTLDGEPIHVSMLVKWPACHRGAPAAIAARA